MNASLAILRLSGPEIIDAYAVGAAAIAFWLIVRYPARSPQRIQSAFVVIVAAAFAMAFASALFEVVARSGRFGAAIALVGIFLPTLVGSFWAAASALRVTARYFR